MDIAYDHSFEEAVTTQSGASDKGKEPEREKESLNEELQQAYKAISNSPWGARFGAFVGTVKKQGESYYETAKKEYPTVAEQATKGFTDLRSNIVARTRALSLTGDAKSPAAGESSATTQNGLLDKLRKGAAEKIRELEEAEARADAYLLQLGHNVGSFLREAITIDPGEKGEVMFEAKGGEEGAKKRVFTTRLDAQLHVLHTKSELFTKDPAGDSYAEFGKTYDVDKETAKIAGDLERYPELRETMEKLVPDTVEYKTFWTRYYFLRSELDAEEVKRKELVKGAAAIEEEEVGWDEDDSEEEDSEDEEDSDDDDEESSDEESEKEKKTPVKAPVKTPAKAPAKAPADAPVKAPIAKASTDTLQPVKPKVSTSTDRSSQPDSEASYDVVSGAPSKTPSATAGSPPKKKVDDSSDEEADWE